jgi:3-phosphoshikimate 1-carboxyvinyltransferase
VNKLVIQPPVTLHKASIELPLSKSIANRMLIIGYLAGNESLVKIPDSKDSVTMQRLIQGLRDNNFKEFDSGDAGTVFRFLTALLSVIPGTRTLTGSHRMKQRPVGALVDALRSLGVDISYSENEGYPPLTIHGKKPEGGYVKIDGSVSSQFISALMMIGPLMEMGLKLKIEGRIVSLPYIELTASLMRDSGIDVKIDGSEIIVQPGVYSLNSDLSEADWSAASYWFALVSLIPGSSLLLKGLKQHSNQGDSKLTDIFSPLGVNSEWLNENLLITNSGKRVNSIEINLTGQPDLAPAVAVACSGNQVNARLTGLETLVIKESNRLEALKTELAKLGYHSEIENNNALILVSGASSLISNSINTYNDHRIAMSMGVLSSVKSPLIINDPLVVDKSYPGFWDHLKQCGFIVSPG